MPFIANTTLVSGPISGANAGAASGSAEDFIVTKTTS
jgi:hypothetical protein